MKKLIIILSSFVLVFALVVPASANQYGLTSIDGVWDKDVFPYALVQQELVWLDDEYNDWKYVYYLYVFSNEIYYDSYFSSIKTYDDEDIVYEKYEFVNGKWLYLYNSAETIELYGNDDSPFLWCSIEIYDDLGNEIVSNYDGFFLPSTDLPNLNDVVTDSINDSKDKIQSNMVTLAVAGVACLALLIVFSLFGKRSLINIR